jgi:hypothetical protein
MPSRLKGLAFANPVRRGIDVGSVIQKPFDNLAVAAFRSKVERCAGRLWGCFSRLEQLGPGVIIPVASGVVGFVCVVTAVALAGFAWDRTRSVQICTRCESMLEGTQLALVRAPKETRSVVQLDIVTVYHRVDDRVEFPIRPAESEPIREVEKVVDK